MKTLILETSTEKSCILLAEDGVIKKNIFLQGGPNLSTSLAKETQALLEQENAPIKALFVGEGPGSHTGVRVGMALAKGLSFGWNVPLYRFCSLKAFIPPCLGPFAVLLDARMGGVHLLLGYRESGYLHCEEPLLVKPEELGFLLSEIPCIVSPFPKELGKRAIPLNIQEASLQISELAFRLEAL
ncbi:MAG: tRNA (adenosine(37)-N6)-threonylcarbamoyltransferase complex dimerization subunit type 1 TsaB [Chlamydiales bacterium]|nr:tRNA (adenosine(37)-N6)-threonylcarbamoyltransferase complex dimerization subunit type 1 TsaB [Chlamydiales bacterium]